MDLSRVIFQNFQVFCGPLLLFAVCPPVGNADPGVPGEAVWNSRFTPGEYGKGYRFAENLLQFPDIYRRNAGVGVPYAWFEGWGFFNLYVLSKCGGGIPSVAFGASFCERGAFPRRYPVPFIVPDGVVVTRNGRSRE